MDRIFNLLGLALIIGAATTIVADKNTRGELTTLIGGFRGIMYASTGRDTSGHRT